jgi:hypothetical protein
MNKQETLNRLNAYLGQLIDLETGFVKELVITKGKNATFLREVISDRIGQEKKEMEALAEQEKAEELKNEK